MERRIFSSVNPYVGARYPVHCSCCDSEVKPAITIERGYAVEAISLVEAVDPANETKPAATVTIMEIDNDTQSNEDSKEPQPMNMLSNTVENASEDGALEEGKSTTSMNISVKEDEVIDGNTGETEMKTPVTSPAEKSATSSILDDPMISVEENCVEEQSSQSGEELDTSSDVDEVESISSATFMVPPRVCREIRLALDKARFCLQKINCTTTKRYQELFREHSEHVKAIKKLAAASLARNDSGIVEELYLVNLELIKNMEYLKGKMLDCQHASLLDIIFTLKQDVETELSSLEKFDVQESEEKVKASNNYLMTFIQDSSWPLFGFTSLVVANLGFFSQHWLS